MTRTRTIITIKRPLYKYNGQMYSGDVVTIPITPKSRRKFSLMSEDSITLEFSLQTATPIKIGDYIDDELFGRFFLTADAMPKYNATTGGYDYSLRFDAEYRMWGNWLHCLVSEGERMEASWSLTDRLEVHAQQIVENLTALGFGAFTLDISASNSADVKFITYNGVSVLEAMQTIADTFSCEWWVTMADKTIHFGKCEGSDTPIVMQLGDNVVSMDIANNRNTFANRIYVYGGTQNIPEDYDKKLIFTADGHQGNEWWDVNRPLTQDMVDTNGTAREALTMGAFAVSTSGNVTTLKASTGGWTINSAGGKLVGELSLNILDNLSSGVSYDIAVALYATGSLNRTIHSESGVLPSPQLARVIALDEDLPSNSYSGLQVTVTLTNNGGGTLTITTKDITTSGLAVEKKGVSVQATLTIVGDTTAHPITINPNNVDSALAAAGHFVFDNGTPSGFVLGTQYTIQPLGIGVPLTYYTSEYNVGTLSKVGERRIHLPLAQYPNRYIETGTSIPEKMVELAVAFESIYPRLNLKVTAVRTETRRTKIEHDDNSVSYETWLRYIIKVSKEDGSAFTFSDRYLLAGSDNLKVHFIAPSAIPAESPALLTGMAFECGFDEAAQEYTIIRNEDYGVTLPNATLHPEVGDRLFLTGWNPRAIAGLGLVDDAEAELATKAQEYLAAIEQGQYTITCHMMSDWMQEQATMPIEGAKVTIIHNALPSGRKTSRVIGYDVALDMPWDSPAYTIGETKAYSRLAQIEKEITNIK